MRLAIVSTTLNTIMHVISYGYSGPSLALKYLQYSATIDATSDDDEHHSTGVSIALVFISPVYYLSLYLHTRCRTRHVSLTKRPRTAIHVRCSQWCSTNVVPHMVKSHVGPSRGYSGSTSFSFLSIHVPRPMFYDSSVGRNGNLQSRCTGRSSRTDLPGCRLKTQRVRADGIRCGDGKPAVEVTNNTRLIDGKVVVDQSFM